MPLMLSRDDLDAIEAVAIRTRLYAERLVVIKPGRPDRSRDRHEADSYRTEMAAALHRVADQIAVPAPVPVGS